MKHFGKRAIALLLVLVFMVGMLPTSAFAAEVGEEAEHTEHSWGDWIVTVEPSCEEAGTQVRSCAVCGASESEALPPLGHSWGEWTVTADPTCTDAGAHEHTCSVCGVTVSEVIPAPGHSWGEWTVTADPTCTDAGAHEHTCSVCGVTVSEAIPALGHTWGEWTVTAEPDCDDEGAREHTCSVCGVTMSEAVPALGHTWGEETVLTEPTCTEEGSYEHTCSVCGVTANETIPAKGHTWGEWTVLTEPTCDEEGEREHTCTVCGVTEKEAVPAKGHDWTEDNGVDLVQCKVCGIYKIIAEGGSFDLEFDGEQWLVAGDPNADVEDAGTWSAMFAGMTLSGNWAEDLLAVARSQVGYRESAANYAVSTHGQKNGYTRYGAWYGIPYGDWCAMFISFCLNYAGIPESVMPYDSGCASWANALNAAGMFAWPGDYAPKSGDLIFYNGEEGYPDHVGIVSWYDANSGVVHTIEGNLADRVANREVGRYDASIAGYGILPENPALAPKPEIERVEKTISAVADGRTITVSGILPVDAELSVVAIPLGAAEEILNAQADESLAGKKVVVAFDVTILSGGEKYDLEEYGDSVKVSVSDVAEQITDFLHVKIDVTDGNGGLDMSSLNTAMTQKQDSEVLGVGTEEDGAVFFDLTSCSIALGLGDAAKGPNDKIDVTVNVNWSGDRANSVTTTHRPSQVSFMVESSADGSTWTPVEGSFVVSGDTSGDTWSETWNLPAEDSQGNPLTYRFTEINDTEVFQYPDYDPDQPDPDLEVQRYTYGDPQTIGATGTLSFDNTQNWPWPLIDFADYYYADPSSPSYINPLSATIQAGPCSDNNCTNPVEPDEIEAGEEVYYKVGYILDQAQSYPYSNGGRAMFDNYHDVQLSIILPEGLYLMAHGHISGIPAVAESIEIDRKPYTKYVIRFSEDDTSPSGSGSFSIRVRVGNNGTENSISTYDLSNMLHLEAQYDLVDKTLPETSDKYEVKTYQSEDNEGTEDISTVSPDEWGVQKTKQIAPVVNVTAGTATFTWTIKVGLKSGEPQYEDGASNPEYLLIKEEDYKRTGREAVTLLTLGDELTAGLSPDSGETVPAPEIKIKRDGGTTEKTLTGTSVTVWSNDPENPADPDLELLKKTIIISDDGSTPNVTTPVYTTYTVTAVYDVSGLLGEFYDTKVLNLDTTNKINLAAEFATLEDQGDSDQVAVSAPLTNKKPASFHIEKKLNQYTGGQTDYDGRYGTITYTLANSASGEAAPTIYTKNTDGSYSEYTGALETGSDHVYYVLPGSYTMSETVDPDHVNDMSPVSAAAAKTGSSASATGVDSVTFAPSAEEDWTVTFTNKENRGKIDILKTNETGQPLPSAQFQLKNKTTGEYIEVELPDGTKTDKPATDSNGKLSFTNLPYGTYELSEYAAPPGYTGMDDVNGLPKEVVIGDAPNNAHSFTFKNKQTKAALTLTKYTGTSQVYTGDDATDIQTFKQVNFADFPATFKLYRYSETDPTPEWVKKDVNGEIIGDQNNPGILRLPNTGTIAVEVPAKDGQNKPYTYYFVETFDEGSEYYPVDGAAGDPSATSRSTTLDEGGTGAINMFNRRNVGIRVFKNFYHYNNAGTGSSAGSATTSEVTSTSGTTLSSADMTVPVTLWRWDGKGANDGNGNPASASQLVQIGTEQSARSSNSDDNPTAYWDDLPIYYTETDETGTHTYTYTYYVLEDLSGITGNPENAADYSFDGVDTSQQGKTIVQIPAQTGEKYVKIDVSTSNNTFTARLYNYQKSIPVRVVKNDPAGRPSITDCYVSVYTDETCQTPAYDAQNGKELTNLKIPNNGTGATFFLKEGYTYYYKETTIKSGYEFVSADTDDDSVTVVHGGVIELVNVTHGNAGQGKAYIIVNQQMPTLTIRKKSTADSDAGQANGAHTVPGAVYTVFTKNASGKYEPYCAPGTTTPVTITANGQSSGVKLPAGDYYFAETTVPENYLDPNTANGFERYKELAPGGETIYFRGETTETPARTLTFVKATVNSGSTQTFIFYNIPLKGNVQVKKRIDGQEVNKSGFTVELWNGSTQYDSETVHRTGDDGTVTFSNVPVFDADGNWITYTVKEGDPETWDPASLKDEYDRVSGSQQVRLVPGKTVTKDTQNNKLYVDNTTRIKITAQKDKRNSWMYGHGGFDVPMGGATIGLYRRVKAQAGEQPGLWTYVMQANTGAEGTDNAGKVSFDKLPRNDENGKPYEYALVELNSGDPKYSPIIKGEIEDGAYPADTTTGLSDEQLFGDNPVYNALRVPEIGTATEYNLAQHMVNGNHWVQFHVTKWKDANSQTANKEQGIGDANGDRRYPEDRLPGSPDTKLDDCVYSLYRYVLSENQSSVAFDRSTWQLVGTYTSGSLLDANEHTLQGEFLTDPELGVTDRYVYVLVEDNVGPNSVTPNPYYVYTFWHYPGVNVTCTVNNSPIVRNFAYLIDQQTATDVLNSWDEGPGHGNILLAAFRLAKWRDHYKADGTRAQEYEPLSNAVFTLSLPNGTVIATMTSGLDPSKPYAFAQSGTFQLIREVDPTTHQFTGKYTMVEYEVPQAEGRPYDVTDYVHVLQDPAHPDWAIYGVEVTLEETGVPNGYGYPPRTYPSYLVFVDKDPGGRDNKYRFYSDLYLVSSTNPGVSLAEYQEGTMWHATDNDPTTVAEGQDPIYIELGSNDLQRLVNYPMTNTSVEVHKVGYKPNGDTVHLDSEAIARRPDAVPLNGVAMKLYVKNGNSWTEYKYDGTKSTFTTDHGTFLFPDGLPMGTYRIIETSLGTGNSKYEMAYDNINSHYREFVVGGVPMAVYMANPEKLDLKVIKTSTSGERLTGWTFKLNGVGATTVSSDPGAYYFNDLGTGTYTLTETAPSGSAYTDEYFKQWFTEKYPDLAALVNGGMLLGYSYETNALTSGESTVGSDWVVGEIHDLDGAVEITVQNPKKVSLNLTKVKDGTETAVNGARFRIRRLDFETVTDVTENTVQIEVQRPAAGTTVTQTDNNFSSWTPVKDGTTDYWQTKNGGKISLTGLKPGIYAIYEYQAPTGYELLKDADGKLVVYTAVITGGLPVNVTVKLGDDPAPNVTTGTETVNITAPNVPRTLIKARKTVDASGLNNNEIGNWSVTLKIYASETATSELASATIEKKGNQITTQPVTFKKGTTDVYFSHNTQYWLEEIVNVPDPNDPESPDYVVPASNFIWTSYQLGGNTYTVTPGHRYSFTVGTADTIEITAVNQYLYGKVSFSKWDKGYSNRLPGAKFEVRHLVGNQWVKIDAARVSEYSTGRYKAIFPLDSKTETTYRIYETKAPDGYVIDPDPEKTYVEVKLRWDDHNPGDRGNVKDFTESVAVFESIVNLVGNPLEIQKYGFEKDAPSMAVELQAGDVKFTLYHQEKNETGASIWKRVTEIAIDADGKATFDGNYLLVPGEYYAVAETYFNPNKFIGPAGFYDGDTELTTVDTEVTNGDGTTATVKAYRFRNINFSGKIAIQAYNIPYLAPMIRKLDVGQYPEGAHASMKFKVFELPEGYNLPEDKAEKDALVTTLSASTNTTDTTIPRIVFQDDTTNTAHEAEEVSTTYEGVTGNVLGTQMPWKTDAQENRWDHNKRYILVETKVAATDATYDTMVKDDSRVHWYLVIDPIADPKEAPIFTLTNINGIAGVKLTKTVVKGQGDVDDTGTVDSLVSGSRDVVYTLAPDVTGKNQMLKSFFLKETGLAALTAEDLSPGEAAPAAVPDYEITKVVVGNATHVLPAALDLSGAPIFADVIFMDAGGSAIGNTRTIPLQDSTEEDRTLTAPGGTKTFTIEYYSPKLLEKTKDYKLAEQFKPDPTTVYMTVKQITATPAVHISKFKNTAEAELVYPKWTDEGGGPTDTTITWPAKEIVSVRNLEIPLVGVGKIIDAERVSTGGVVPFILTISNKELSTVPFKNPMLLDILPTGVTFYDPGEDQFKPKVIIADGDLPFTLKYTPMIGEQVQSSVEDEDHNVYVDAETCVLFELTGVLLPGHEVQVQFYGLVGPSALLYDQASETVKIQNDVYLSSAEHTYKTPQNPNGYSFAISGNSSEGYIFGSKVPTGDDIAAAASVNPTAAVHEEGVHKRLKNEGTSEPDYTNGSNFIWIRAYDDVPVVAGQVLTLHKQVKGDRDSIFHGEEELGVATRTFTDETSHSHDLKNGYVDWLLIIDAGPSFPAKKLVVGDAIPKVGDVQTRKSCWDVDFDSITSIQLEGSEVSSTRYTVWYYTGPIEGASDVIKDTLLAAREWETTPPDPNLWDTNMPADKSKITGFVIVFDPTLEIAISHALTVMYHTLVPECNDDEEFAKIAFLNATNDFYVLHDDFTRAEKSNPVSVTLMDQDVEVQGDVWIDEDWDAEQQAGGNRRDYSQYAIIQELVGDGTDANRGRISFTMKDERRSAAGSIINEAARGTNTSIGESIRHFTFEHLGAALYTGDAPLYGPDHYLNAGSHKIGDGLYGALKGTDPFHYSLNATFNAGDTALMDIFKLTTRGSGHYMSDDPDNLAGLEERANALDSNFEIAGRAVANYSTYPFYIRYSALVDQSKDIGYRSYRGLIINKVADDNHDEALAGVKFSIYGPYEDTTVRINPEDPNSETFAPKTPAYGFSGDGLLKFSGSNGVYTLDPSGTVTELVTDANGQIQVSGLNWWKEYEVVETETITPYSIEGTVIPDESVCTQILDEGNGKFMLLVPATGKTSEMGSDVVTVTNKRGLDFKFQKLSAEVTVNGEGVDVITTPSPLADATFGLFTDETCETPFKRGDQAVTATSDSDGWVTFTLLPYGTYYMKEIGGSSAYWLNTSIYEVKVQPKDSSHEARVLVRLVSGSGSETAPDAYGRTGILEYKVDTPTTGHYEILNLKVKVKAKLIKIDEFQQTKKLPGAQFGLFTDEACETTPIMTVTTDSNGEASFGWLEPGTYYMKETVPPTGYPLSDTVYTLTITYSSTDNTVSVTFDGKAVTLDNGKATFSVTVKNTPSPATLQIPVKKELDGETPAQGVTMTFDFELTAVDGAPMPATGGEKVTVTWPTPNTGTFGEISFTEPRTYEYKVKEVIPENRDPHIAYDDTEYTVTVTVVNGTGENEGKLVVSYTSTPAKDEDGNLVFTNTYTPDPVKLKIPVKKVITSTTGTAPTSNAEFTFTIAAKTPADAPLPSPATVTIQGAGSATFGEISYTKAGIYTYTVKETGCDDTSHYKPLDSTEWTVEVTVADTADKILKVTGYKITKGSETTEATSAQLPHSALPENLCTPTTPALAVVFDNPYTPDPVKLKIPVKKEITNTTGTAPTAASKTGASFTFTIAAQGDAPLPSPATLSVKPDEVKTFGEIAYTKAGVYKYTVTETAGSNTHYTPLDNKTWNIEVTVENTDADVLKVTGYTATNGEKTVTLTSAQLAPMHNAETNVCTITDANAAVFTNPYTPDPVKLKIPVKKEIPVTTDPDSDGTDPKKKETFTFTIARVTPADAPLPSPATVTIEGEGSETFGEITYTKAGTYTYKVTETAGGNTHYQYSTKEWTVTVTVDNTDEDVLKVTGYTATDGEKTVTLTSAQLAPMHNAETNVCTITVANAAVFTNPYTPDPVKLVIPVQKTISGDDTPSKPTTFTFTITAKTPSDSPLPSPASTTISGAGTGAFPQITYTKAGTYTYTVKETEGSAHYAYSKEEWTVEVKVENTAADVLKVTSYKVTSKSGEVKEATSAQLPHDAQNVCTPTVDALAAVFDNPFTPPPAKLKIPVKKIMVINMANVNPDISFSFTFDLAAKGDAPMPASGSTVTITWPNPGEGTFGEITFTKAGTYEYTVTERAGIAPGVVYDTTPRNVVVTVTVNKNDELEAHYSWSTASTASAEGEGTEATSDAEPAATGTDTAVEFTNMYRDGSLELWKHVSGNLGDYRNKFRFKIELRYNGKVLTDSYPYKVYTADGILYEDDTIKSGGYIELKHNWHAVITGLPVGAYYEVTEVTSRLHIVTSTGEEGLIVETTPAKAVFINHRSNVPKTGETDLLPVTIPMMGASGIGMLLTALFGKKRKSRKSK